MEFAKQRNYVICQTVIDTVHDICNGYNISIPNNIALKMDTNGYKNALNKHLNSWNGDKKINEDLSYKKYWYRARNWFDQNKFKTVAKFYWIPIFDEINSVCNFIVKKIHNKNDDTKILLWETFWYNVCIYIVFVNVFRKNINIANTIQTCI